MLPKARKKSLKLLPEATQLNAQVAECATSSTEEATTCCAGPSEGCASGTPNHSEKPTKLSASPRKSKLVDATTLDSSPAPLPEPTPIRSKKRKPLPDPDPVPAAAQAPVPPTPLPAAPAKNKKKRPLTSPPSPTAETAPPKKPRHTPPAPPPATSLASTAPADAAPRTVILSGCPPTIDEAALRVALPQMESACFVKHGKFAGTCFVTFPTAALAEESAARTDLTFESNPIRLRMSSSAPPATDEAAVRQLFQEEDTRQCYVSNIAAEVTEDELKTAFEGVETVKFFLFGSRGERRNSCFVKFQSAELARKAAAMKALRLHGQRIIIEMAGAQGAAGKGKGRGKGGNEGKGQGKD